ncbi:MAG: DUF3822 family protein [Saprospiraceae bacterium]|nr:DUF3822 family protein [Saprospiraceae bacterium]
MEDQSNSQGSSYITSVNTAKKYLYTGDVSININTVEEDVISFDLEHVSKSDNINYYFQKSIEADQATFLVPYFNVVPKDSFYEEDIELYIKSTFPNYDREHFNIRYDFVSTDYLYVIYAIPKSVNIQNTFNHFISKMLACNRKLIQDNNQTFIHVYFQQNEFVLTAYKDGKLIQCNFYKFYDQVDALYFIMLSINQIEFDQKTDHLHISGRVIEDSSLYRLLSQFINHIHLVNNDLKSYSQLHGTAIDEQYIFDVFGLLH